VVLMPEPTPAATSRPTFAADPDGAYVVTGGLSGFGLEAARWLSRSGARRLALIGRRGGSTPGAADALAAFRSTGVRAEAIACDIADEIALGRALAHIRRSLGPVRGVLHAAMVLDDALLKDMDAPRFEAVLRPKLAGAMALDRLTREDALQLFVLFSSVTTVIGTAGQAGYVAANAAMEALAGRRQAAGLPALAVLWGPIADAGYLARERRVSEMLAAVLGSTHLRAVQALDALPALLECGRPVAGFADLAWDGLRSRLPGLAAAFWSEMPVGTRMDISSQPIRARIAGLPAGEAVQAVLDLLVEEVARILQQSPSTLDVNRPMAEFGIDSLMAVELFTALDARGLVKLPLAMLAGGTTLRKISVQLLERLQAEEAVSTDGMAEAIFRHEGDSAVESAGGAP